MNQEVILNPLSNRLVDLIFTKMALLCRGFDSLYADRKRLNAEKTQWVLSFSKLGIVNKNQIELGLNKLELHKFPNPPQLGEFLEWCKKSPSEHGLPHIHRAFAISMDINKIYSRYIHPHVPTDTVIRHAINQIGATELRTKKTEEEAFKIFEHYYAVACQQYIDGEIKDIPRAIPEKPLFHPSDKEKSDEARLKAMRAMKAFINIRIPEDEVQKEC